MKMNNGCDVPSFRVFCVFALLAFCQSSSASREARQIDTSDQFLSVLDLEGNYKSAIPKLTFASLALDGTIAFSDIEGRSVILWRNGRTINMIGGKGLETSNLCRPYQNAIGQNGDIFVIDFCRPKLVLKRYKKGGDFSGSLPMEHNGELNLLPDGKFLLGKPLKRDGDVYILHVLEESGISKSVGKIDPEMAWLVGQYASLMSVDIHGEKIFAICSVLRTVWVFNLEMELLQSFEMAPKETDTINLYFGEGRLPKEKLRSESHERITESCRPWKIVATEKYIIVSWLTPVSEKDRLQYLIDVYDTKGNPVRLNLRTNASPIGVDKEGRIYFRYETKEDEFLRIITGRMKIDETK